MIKELEDKLSKGFKYIELNERKWFLKPNGTIFALMDDTSNNQFYINYADTVMSAAINDYNSSKPVSLNQSLQQINMMLSEIIMSI